MQACSVASAVQPPSSTLVGSPLSRNYWRLFRSIQYHNRHAGPGSFFYPPYTPNHGTWPAHTRFGSTTLLQNGKHFRPRILERLSTLLPPTTSPSGTFAPSPIDPVLIRRSSSPPRDLLPPTVDSTSIPLRSPRLLHHRDDCDLNPSPQRLLTIRTAPPWRP